MTQGGAPLGEFELIDRFFVRARPHAQRRGDVALGIGDDAALLRVPDGADLVAAVDTLVAGRHFLADADPRSIGYRALAVNLSDLAAMGATPAWATLALTVPSADGAWLQEFSTGLMDLAAVHGVELVGGDTTAGPLTISVQLMGYVERGTALRRGGASAGDLIVVTGTLGDAGAGLALRTGRLDGASAEAAAWLMRRFDYPTPRVEFGAAVRGIASGAMDVSDGLSGDLPKLAAASGLAARLDVESLPLSEAMRSAVPEALARDWALSAGDDYELLITVPPRRLEELAMIARRLNLTLTIIGTMLPGSGVTWRLNGGICNAPPAGYDHFR